MQQGPIGVFDSDYGGLTILKELRTHLPQYDYLYLGDNARAPYGTRSFESVYQYTLECVKLLFEMKCRLVILACNTASAKALRTIQQNDLPIIDDTLRVLGVIRPTSEVLGSFTTTGHVGVLGTSGTISSQSYPIEIEKFFPHIKVHQQACPMWVPLVENNEFDKDGADYFIEKDIKELLSQSSEIDTIVLGCTHYPLLIEKIRKHLPPNIKILSQGDIVAHSLEDYLLRHPEMENVCSKNGSCTFLTTDSSGNFDDHAALFFGEPVISSHIHL